MITIDKHKLKTYPQEQGKFYTIYCPVSNSILSMKKEPYCCPMCRKNLAK